MDTPTPKLGLRRFLGLDDFDFADVNFNSDTIDMAIGLTVCTSSTRPTSLLFPGRRIYETDTTKYYLYNNGSWVEDTITATLPTIGLSGTSASKPASGAFIGQRYWDTTNEIWWEWNGTVWVPGRGIAKTYTPTWTNMPAPTDQEAHYYFDGEWVHVLVTATLSAAATGQVGLPLPVNTVSRKKGFLTFGTATFKDSSAGQYIIGQAAKMLDADGVVSDVNLYFPASSTNTNTTAMGATTPVAAASGDYVSVSLMYRRALA